MSQITDPTAANSIPALLVQRVEATPDAPAFRYRAPGGTASDAIERGTSEERERADSTGWTTMTWAQAQDRARAIAAGLIGLGITDESRVAILSGTRVEWVLADLGILAAGGATTTIYPSNTAAECAYVITDSDTRVVIAENDAQVAKLREVREQIPSVSKVVVIDGPGDADRDATERGTSEERERSVDTDWVISLADLEADGAKRAEVEPAAYAERVAGIGRERLATLMYTSGTTGRPKGVELTHGNWVYEAETLSSLGLARPDDLHFLWLPMSHSFGKVLTVMMIAAGTESVIDGDVTRLVANLGEVRPTLVAAAPRVFEKAHNTIVATVRNEGGVKAKLFGWARGVGLTAARARQQGKSPSVLTQAQLVLADRLVLSKIRARFGGRIRYFVSGSAPLATEIAEFFDAAGMPILEGYGLTESSAASFANRPGAQRYGTVGPPMPGTEVKIAEDGEVLFRGPGIMRGYHGMPEETAATLLEGGWLATGDIGELDAEGRLRITDRKKELIKTSGGKYVAPAPIESQLKATCPYVANVVVHGDRRNYCVALITLDPDVTRPWAKEQGLSDDLAVLAQDDTVRAEVRKAVDQVNAALPSYSTIKDFAILATDFTVETGELTASMKVRRKHVEAKFADVLDGFYAGAI